MLPFDAREVVWGVTFVLTADTLRGGVAYLHPSFVAITTPVFHLYATGDRERSTAAATPTLAARRHRHRPRNGRDAAVTFLGRRSPLTPACG